jgi:hypothetical protein
MAYLPPVLPDRVRVTAHAELETAPRAVVELGSAPDGLPWLLEVDRSRRLEQLFSTVLSVFELGKREDLPERVRSALERDVAAGLMGVHEVDLVRTGPSPVYVSRSKLKRLLGATVLSQVLERRAPGAVPEGGGGDAATNVGALAAKELDVEMIEAVERSIHERRAKRHLLLRLADGAAFSGSVHQNDRALRTPQPPYRPLAFESLVDLAGAVAVLSAAGGESWRVPLADGERFTSALLRAHQSRQGGHLRFEVPRASLCDAIAAAARSIGELHRRELVHADVAPGNLLLARGGPVSFDSLDVRAGTPATAATFEWAAPEQIIGLPVDPRTDVFGLGRIVCALLGAVPFGEETRYVVPIGGSTARRVELLKAEGVFIDILETEHTREWQLAWQGFLGRCVAHDASRRPADALRFADELADLTARLPPAGAIDCPGDFGSPVPFQTATGWTFAWLARD